MDVKELMKVLEGCCPFCENMDMHWTIEGHPDHLVESWSADDNTALVPCDNMPRDYTHKMSDGWIENILTIATIKCNGCGAEFYTERNAIDGDWVGNVSKRPQVVLASSD